MNEIIFTSLSGNEWILDKDEELTSLNELLLCFHEQFE